MAPGAPEPDSPEAAERSSGLKELAIVAAAALVFAIFKPDLAKTVAIFVATLGVLVLVHEWGHFQFARWAGLKVNRFALGFPPFIYTKRYKGIDYSLGALPIGGMVDIAGLGSEEEMVAEVRGQGKSVVRNTMRVRGEKQFQDVSLGWRFLTLFAGPLMNFILAIALFIGVYSIAGFPNPSWNAVVDTVTAGQPAAQAGLKPGDQILSVGSQKAIDQEKTREIIIGAGAKSTTITVLRDGKEVTLPITPRLRDIYGTGKPVPSIGISFSEDEKYIKSFNYIKLTPTQAIMQGFHDSVEISKGILGTAGRAVTGKLAPEEKKNIGGPVKIARVMNQAADFGWPVLFKVAAMLSVNLGLLNLLPFPALDGGRILFLGYELIMRRPVDPRKEGLIHAAGMVMLLAFMLFITLRDVIGH